jgi:hypothetical protein
MNTSGVASASREKQQAIENLCNVLHRIYWDRVGREADPEVVWAEAEDLVTKHGPNFDLKDWF